MTSQPQSLVFTPSRLALARARMGMTQRELAKLVGVTDRSIKAFESESDRKTPSESTLKAIASATGFDVSFFYRPSVTIITPEAASFRALSKASAPLRDRATAAGTLGLDWHAYLSARFELPRQDLPDLRDTDPERAADTIRYRWGIGQKPIPNMIHLAERQGVRVFSLSEDCDAIDAFSVWRDGIPYMFLNTRKTAERSIWDAAHELGHLLLHRHGSPHGQDAEKEADRFAANLLLPEQAMRAAAPRLITVSTLTKMKQTWRTSVAALGFRMRELGIMSEWNYRQFCIELARRGRGNEPAPIRREGSAILQKTLAALANEGVSLHDIARETSLPVRELRALSFGFAVVDGGSVTTARRGELRLLEP